MILFFSSNLASCPYTQCITAPRLDSGLVTIAAAWWNKKTFPSLLWSRSLKIGFPRSCTDCHTAAAAAAATATATATAATAASGSGASEFSLSFALDHRMLNVRRAMWSGKKCAQASSLGEMELCYSSRLSVGRRAKFGAFCRRRYFELSSVEL